MKLLNDTMRDAMRQMQSGDLYAATRTIQHGLGNDAVADKRDDHNARESATRARSDSIDVEFRVVDRVDDASSADSRDDTATPGGSAGFAAHHFSCDAGEVDYKLFVPAGLDTTNAPLLVMLHGCTQSVDDFAIGTRMNALAQAHGYVVAYPEQPSSRNANRCWNWFRRGDQQRDRGEPAMLAALTRALITTHRLDARRVYVAGLSAGGAMAAVLASTHADLYAAIGVHSGLPIGLASDVPSAFAAMRNGGSRRSAAAPNSASAPVPAIVFHGDSDKTVHPTNGHGVIAQSLANDDVDATAASGASVEPGTANGGRRYTRTVHRLPDGTIAAEHWIIEGAGHAWSGGDAAGSYTDPRGPDASAEMLRFFSACAR